MQMHSFSACSFLPSRGERDIDTGDEEGGGGGDRRRSRSRRAICWSEAPSRLSGNGRGKREPIVFGRKAPDEKRVIN